MVFFPKIQARSRKKKRNGPTGGELKSTMPLLIKSLMQFKNADILTRRMLLKSKISKLIPIRLKFELR